LCNGEYATKTKAQKTKRYAPDFLLCTVPFTSRNTARHTEAAIKRRSTQPNRNSIMSDIPYAESGAIYIPA
jgi:hypothetical protein